MVHAFTMSRESIGLTGTWFIMVCTAVWVFGDKEVHIKFAHKVFLLEAAPQTSGGWFALGVTITFSMLLWWRETLSQRTSKAKEKKLEQLGKELAWFREYVPLVAQQPKLPLEEDEP